MAESSIQLTSTGRAKTFKTVDGNGDEVHAQAVVITDTSGSPAASPLTDVELRAAPVPVSLADAPLPANAATEATLAGGIAALLTELQQKTEATDVQPVGVVGTVPVSGPLTDAALRAAPVDVTIVSGAPVGLTDAELRATPVPVSAAALPLPADAATQTTLALIKAKTDNIDVALSTRAVTGLTDAQLRAAPVPIADTSTGTLANGAQTPITNTAAQIIAANAARKTAIVQNVGSANIRIGANGVTATTGIQLTPGATFIFQPPYVVTSAIYAIRETVDSTAFATEIT